MQQIREQCRLKRTSRLPTQWRIAMLSGVRPSFITILPAGRARGVAEPLELQAGEDVVPASVAVLDGRRRVEGLEAGGQDDAPTSNSSLVLLLEVDGVGGADLLADPARVGLEVRAVPRVDHRQVRHGLREREVRPPSVAQALVELGRDVAPGTALDAEPAAVAARSRRRSGPCVRTRTVKLPTIPRPPRPRCSSGA